MKLNSQENSLLLEKNNSPISDALLQLHQDFEKVTNSTELETFMSSHDSMLMNESEAKVAVRINAVDVEKLIPSLESLGFEVIGTASELHFVEGMIAIDSITSLESLVAEGLIAISPIPTPIASTGSVTSQADFVLESDRVRNSLPTGFDGTGVEVGVLSDSYNNLNGAATDIASGDLPAGGVTVVQDLSSGGSDEGRALLQLIHDIAPGADLSFATAFGGSLNFANNIRALAQAGADIIVDDVVYLTEPFFQDGVVSLAVDDVVTNHGVAYFSSAGNNGNIAYESTRINFAIDTVGGVTGQFYDFDPSFGIDTRQRVTIPAGARIRLSFQWDDPFFTTDGVDTDLDIVLVDSAGNVVAVSQDNNLVNQTPSEFLVFTNSTSQTDFDVMIRLFSGPQPGRIKYIPFDVGSDPDAFYQEYATNSSTIFGHAAAINASAVAAVPYFDQNNPEFFTSLGPTTILFNSDGTRKPSPEIRQTPRIAAIDGTDTTFFGSDVDGNGFPNLFGTSAAAPHAAAVAALVKQANPSFTPAQIYNRLESTAKDIGAPGFDNLTGFGLINAYDAIFGSVVPAPLNFTDNFEDGDLSRAYETNTNGAGRIQVTSEGGPIGTRHLTLDSSVGLTDPSLNEVILHVDTTGASNVVLSFDQKEFNDEDDLMPERFTGSVNADGVALSVDGTNWFRLISLTGSNSTNTYQTNIFNLSNFAFANGITLGSDVRIKFQQFDNFPISSDGFAFDNISLTGNLTGTSGDGQNLTGNNGNNSLIGSTGDDTISGLGGNDSLVGLAGDDTILGGDGKDTLRGNLGDDLLKGERGFDLLWGDRGNDTLMGGLGGDTLRGGADQDLLQGNSGFDVLFGNNGDDTLLGGYGNDQLKGDQGSDRLDGGVGNDALNGGAGTDFFVLKPGEGNDVISDYVDEIDRFVLGGGLEFNDLRIVQNMNNSQIRLTATNEVLATINSVNANVLNADDFIVES